MNIEKMALFFNPIEAEMLGAKPSSQSESGPSVWKGILVVLYTDELAGSSFNH